MGSNKNDFHQLLDDIQRVTEKYNQINAEKYKKGELFNIFEVLGMSEDEVHTHSAFIAELLNPKGSHGMGSKPLSLFIEILNNIFDFNFDPDHAKVEVEKYIGPITKDYKRGGRIDIFIISGNRAILFENKINAKDQYKQLIRYYNYAKEHYKKNFALLYLNKEWKIASNESITDDKIKLKANEDYYCISYKEEIRNWLQQCLPFANDKPIVKENIIQYLNLISGLTGVMDNKKDEIVSIMRTYPSQVYEILTYQDEYKKDIVTDVLKQEFKKFAEENGFILSETDGFYSGKRQSSLSFRKEDWKNAVISIVAENSMNNYWIAITAKKGAGNLKTPMESLGPLKENPGKGWPFGWCWLPNDYRYLYSPKTIRDIINGTFIKIVGKLIISITEEFEQKPNYREI